MGQRFSNLGNKISKTLNQCVSVIWNDNWVKFECKCNFQPILNPLGGGQITCAGLNMFRTTKI